MRAWSRPWALLAYTACMACMASATEPTGGPPQGTLFIVGGGRMTQLWPVFLELAGGKDSPIVVIPTANDTVEASDPSVLALRLLGATRVTQLHTRDPQLADTAEFAAPLRSARAVWLTGGRQWRLADAYLHTRTLREMVAVLERGGVVGGSSAGASIQASYLVRGSPQGNTIMMARTHEQGFAFLRNSAIDQHVNTRQRADDLRPVLQAHPGLLGIALDEATAIVVNADLCRVLGAGVVRFFPTPSAPPIVLTAGARFNLLERRGLAP